MSLYLSKVVEYISVSLIQDASSLEKKILTAMDSPFQMPRQTSPYLSIMLMCMDHNNHTLLAIYKHCARFQQQKSFVNKQIFNQKQMKFLPALANALSEGNLLCKRPLDKEG